MENKSKTSKLMKKIFLLFIFAASTLLSFGQNQSAVAKNEWTRIESENKEVFVSLPSDFLADAEKKSFDNQSLRVISFQNGVQMEFLIFNVEKPQKHLKELKTGSESKTIDSGGNSFTLKRISGSETEKYFFETIYLASKKYLYCFYVRAENADKPEISRFLYSIKANGKPIFISKEREKINAEKSLSVAQIKTSSEIQTALNQSFENTERKINYEFKKLKINSNPIDFSVRPEIILVEPFPSGKSLSVRPAFLASYMGQNSGSATIKMKLSANGQVGDVTVFSTSDRRVLYEFMEGIKKFRFLPAMKNGKAVDSELIIEFEFPYY